MRKVRNPNIKTSSPALMFAQGVESIVADHLENPRHMDEVKKAKQGKVVSKPEPRGNFFNLLMRQFANNY